MKDKEMEVVEETVTLLVKVVLLVEMVLLVRSVEVV